MQAHMTQGTAPNAISAQDFKAFADFLKRRSGIMLAADKMYLLESRLRPLMRRHSIAHAAELIRQVTRMPTSALADEAVDAMTTNETFFFRDKTPFENFQRLILPSLLQARSTRKQLRIWCAAASTGQEPYSLAMCLKEAGARLAGWRVEILGTDISTDALTKAEAGKYTQFEVQRGLPAPYLVKYFRQEGAAWYVKDELKQMIQFRPFNLLDPFTSLGQFDVIYCRNVLIYFDPLTKKNILGRLATNLSDDGFLSMGAAETVVGLCDAFKPVDGSRGLYGKHVSQPSLMTSRSVAQA